MELGHGRLNKFGIMYSGDEDPEPFKEAYHRVKDDPWGSLNYSLDIFRGRQVDRYDLSAQSLRNLRSLEAVVEDRMPFFDGLPVTITYHVSTLYGSPIKNDMDYIVIINPNYLNRYVYADACTLNRQVEEQLVRTGIQPDSIVIENRGIGNSRFKTDDYLKLLTAIDISLFILSVPIYGFNVYEQIQRQYMELLHIDSELLTLTATVQVETLHYHIGRWGLSDELLE